MIGILLKWECPSCGNLMATKSPFWDDHTRKNITKPNKCGCGRSSGFNLFSLEQCEFEVIPKGCKVVDPKGEVLAENKAEEQEQEDE